MAAAGSKRSRSEDEPEECNGVDLETTPVGAILSMCVYMRVLREDAADPSKLIVSNGETEWHISKSIIKTDCRGTHVQRREKVAQSKLAEIMLGQHRGDIVECVYTKKADDTAGLRAIDELVDKHAGKKADEIPKKLKRAALAAIRTGERRTMKCIVYGMNDTGRLNVVDMALALDTGKKRSLCSRQVDPRTLESVIIRGVQYHTK